MERKMTQLCELTQIGRIGNVKEVGQNLADAEGRLEAVLSKPLERNAEAPDPETHLNKTRAEQELRLQDFRGRVEREAERETDRANRASAAHETNVAQGSERNLTVPRKRPRAHARPSAAWRMMPPPPSCRRPAKRSDGQSYRPTETTIGAGSRAASD